MIVVKILWIVNTIFPFPSQKLNIGVNVFGGWLNSLFECLKKSDEIDKIAIATTYTGEKFLKFQDEHITYYLLPCKNNKKYDKSLEPFWKQINTEFNPDVIHIHGTEYAHSLSWINACSNKRVIVSIQGLISIYSRPEYYFAGLSHLEIRRSITIRDLVKFDTIFSQQKKFKKRGKYEKLILEKCKFAIGRTSWDNANCKKISPNINYYIGNESLRSVFYDNTWQINKIKKHTIFISQASYPIKGFHNVLKAANILIKKYPDLKIYVSGIDITGFSKSKVGKLAISGYGKYLSKKIKKFGLNNVIIFTGLLKDKEVCNHLLSCNVFVQASSIENSPNSLGEAMLLGVPCVASYVGGTGDMLRDKEEGFLFPFYEYSMMAKYISDIFENDNLAVKISEAARKRALVNHNKEKNAKAIINIYKDVICKG